MLLLLLRWWWCEKDSRGSRGGGRGARGRLTGRGKSAVLRKKKLVFNIINACARRIVMMMSAARLLCGGCCSLESSPILSIHGKTGDRGGTQQASTVAKGADVLQRSTDITRQ